jgi:uncharacterized protein (TIGR02217 family)
MTITIYTDLILPETVMAAGVRGKQIRRNSRVTTQGGYVSANIVWSRTLREFEIGYIPMLPSAWADIEGLHEITEGGAIGFLMQDPKDRGVSYANGGLQAFVGGVATGTPGVGNGGPTYRLAKIYRFTGSSRVKSKPITRPVTGSVGVQRNAAAVTEGSGAGEIDVDLTTGVVTFEPDDEQTVIGFQNNFFSANFTLAAELTGVGIGDYLYIDGMTGADAGSVNGLSYLVTNLSVDSSGAVYTVDGEWYYYFALDVSGTGYQYPQPSDVLTAQADYYVPVHFANDDIDWEIVRSGPEDGRLIAGPSVLLREVRE